MPENIIEFWCQLPIDLGDVFDGFCREFPVGEHVRDAENVWAWYDGRTSDDVIGFNISQAWNNTRQPSIPVGPVRLSLAVRDLSLTREEIGRRLALAIGADVHTGTVKYVRSNDEFAFDIEDTYRRPT